MKCVNSENDKNKNFSIDKNKNILNMLKDEHMCENKINDEYELIIKKKEEDIKKKKILLLFKKKIVEEKKNKSDEINKYVVLIDNFYLELKNKSITVKFINDILKVKNEIKKDLDLNENNEMHVLLNDFYNIVFDISVEFDKNKYIESKKILKKIIDNIKNIKQLYCDGENN